MTAEIYEHDRKTCPHERIGRLEHRGVIERESVQQQERLSAPLTCTPQVRLLLKPGGKLCFVEHGLAPDEKVQRTQHRLEPLNKRLFGCYLTREVVDLLTDGGFIIIEADVFYSDGGPKSFAAETLGVAVSP